VKRIAHITKLLERERLTRKEIAQPGNRNQQKLAEKRKKKRKAKPKRGLEKLSSLKHFRSKIKKKIPKLWYKNNNTQKRMHI